jgi:hypothetical protein
MKHRTLLDISSRTSASEGEIVDLGKLSGPRWTQPPNAVFTLNPIVRLVGGPLCREWAFELKQEHAGSFFRGSPKECFFGEKSILVIGQIPLFPGRSTKVAQYDDLEFTFPGPSSTDLRKLVATLYLGSAQLVERTFELKELLT